MEVGCELDAVGRIEVNGLHLSPEVFALCEGAHDGKTIAEDEAVCPFYVVLIKLDGFVVCQLRVSEEIALDVFSCGDVHDCLCADAFVDVQRDRVYRERLRFLFTAPFQPRFVVL